MELPAEEFRDAFNAWFESSNTGTPWDVLTMELHLHARRNPVFAERFYEIEDRLNKFHAERIAERFGQTGRQTPLDPLVMSLVFRTLACGLGLKIQTRGEAGQNEAARILCDVIDVMLEASKPA
jgi:hypothetical protein